VVSTSVYTTGSEVTYEFNYDSYAALAAAGIAWQDVIYALHDSRPKSAGTSGRC
jgi:hypothetical protein